MKSSTIYEIEALTQYEAEQSKTEKHVIKGHECYLIDLGGYFGYSCLVFKSGHHIYYVNDYELHHQGKTRDELTEIYLDKMNNKLFTEAELMEPVKTYNEYTHKSYYVRNYWVMQFDHVSSFYIGEPDERQKKAHNTMIFCPVCFCYVNDLETVKNANKFINNIESTYREAMKNKEIFRNMISYELANHEAGITCSAEDALTSLNLDYNSLTAAQKKIVNDELDIIINICM